MGQALGSINGYASNWVPNMFRSESTRGDIHSVLKGLTLKGRMEVRL